MSGSKLEAWAKGFNAVVVTGGSGFGGDADSGSGGGADVRGGGYGWDGDCDGQLVKWGGYCSKHNLRERA